ncbi:MAG TPA: alginate export family protein [Candidatus Eisenbacteria bacterium]|jgi:hypothetical protein|nr:alginate export family protein [Candidatus Eisenbacteria bacterium]
MKSLKALFVLAIGLALAVPAFAETQNVKVSGSIDAYAFYRDNYDLNGGDDRGTVPPTGAAASGTNAHKSDADEYWMGITQVEVSADLTDNVSTVVNLINQRDWNASAHSSAGSTTNSTQEFDITLDLAYVQMKEIFYSPLTLTVGRQDIWFGRGFIVGNNNRAWDPQGALEANEYSVTTAFDAIRATLDFNPWTIDAIYSKIDEGSHDPEDDLDLFGVNINYKFAEYNAVAEAYWFTEDDRNTIATVNAATTGDTRMNDTHTIGGRVQFDPISQITLGAEVAYQFGNYRAVTSTANPERDRSAWAFDLFGTYRWDYTWKPELTLEWVSFGGEADTTAASTSDYGAWNGLYRGRFYTAYGDFREFVYGTTDAADQSATTNQDLLQLKGAIKPMEDLLLESSFTWFWTPESVTSAGSTRNDDLGWEVDFQATYDYTEDVSFGLLMAWFVPGDFYQSPADDTATDIVSSVKVTF